MTADSPDHGRVKFRVVEFELEGANATLIEGVRNLAATITRGNGRNGHQDLKTVQAITPTALPSDTSDEEVPQDEGAFGNHACYASASPCEATSQTHRRCWMTLT